MGELLTFPRPARRGPDAILSRSCELYAIPGLTGDRVAIIHRGQVVVVDGPAAVRSACVAPFKARVRARRATRAATASAAVKALALAPLTLAAWGFALGLAAGLAFAAGLTLNGAH